LAFFFSKNYFFFDKIPLPERPWIDSFYFFGQLDIPIYKNKIIPWATLGFEKKRSDLNRIHVINILDKQYLIYMDMSSAQEAQKYFLELKTMEDKKIKQKAFQNSLEYKNALRKYGIALEKNTKTDDTCFDEALVVLKNVKEDLSFICGILFTGKYFTLFIRKDTCQIIFFLLLKHMFL
jgi:hypothetical protein